MPAPLKVVAVIGSTSPFSRTLVLAHAMLDALSRNLLIDRHVVELTHIGRELGQSLVRGELPVEIERELQRIESADMVLAAAPVYRGSYPGLFKHLFDMIETDAFVNKPVLLAATGGSERHALVIEHQLRPLFGFLQALTLPVGVYGTPADFDGQRVSNALLLERIALAAERAAAVLGKSDPETNMWQIA
ncbi:MAG TPA: FMN reductase [Dyella sp.]|uniref:FMN reductase n=1 Tax=Dyella sp. TaxID=1869338 RepID=UPI002B68D197|nr:FMN reductase [Dyella sp.]HTV86012.1 FMN reductase [Dyella sp.]